MHESHPSQRELTRIIEAVAALDTFASGPNDDRYCPFDCGWEEYGREQHDNDCPITLARKVKDSWPTTR